MHFKQPTLTLSACLALGFTSASGAVSLNPNGAGQVLIIPYYTTLGGNDTLLALTNNSSQGRAVKVRVNESRIGRVAQDINLYLGPNDSWSTAIVDGAPFNVAGAALVINDDSCLVLHAADNQLFHPLPDGRRLLALRDPGATGIPADGGPQGPDRAREGSIEIIEMGVIEPDSITADRLQLIDGAPADCAAISDAWTAPNGDWIRNPDLDLAAPTGLGSLSALVMIVDPARGSLFEVPVDALAGFSHQRLHTAPGSVEPTLASVNDVDDPDLATAVIVAGDGNVLSATYADDLDSGYGKIDAISALYAASSLSNDYFLTDTESVRAHSEWVLHSPTRRFYVDTQIEAGTGNQFVAAARAPFPGDMGSEESCFTQSTPTFVDRAGAEVSGPFGNIGTPPPGWHLQNAFCWQTSTVVIGFDPDDGDSPILGSLVGGNLFDLDMASEGRLRFDFAGDGLREPLEGTRFAGLPVTGFFVTVFDNAFVAGGTLANYAASFRHHIRQEAVPD